jgi:hypothetical protein
MPGAKPGQLLRAEASSARERWGGAVSKKRDESELRLFETEPEIAAPAALEIDVAESRWDPWLLALARMAAQDEARVN